MEGQQTEKAELVQKCADCGAILQDCSCKSDSLPVFDPWLGKRLNDQYEISSLIARGGMGAVYRAKHLLLGTNRAIKVIRQDMHRDESVYQRFKQEAQAVAGLNHPGIVSFHDFGIVDSAPYVVMDLVEGIELDEFIKSKGKLSIELVLKIFVQIAEALDHAHKKGIFHRDIKPSNIMLVEDTSGNLQAKILDFGIAKITTDAESVKLTSTGEVFGSPAYMSPEQGRGQRVDARSDIYSLGCVMFEALMGTAPFLGSSPIETIMKHLNEPAPKITQTGKIQSKPADFFQKTRETLSETATIFFGMKSKADPIFQDMQALISRCLEKDPEKRYESMSALASDLQRLNYGERLLILQREMNKRRRSHMLVRIYNGALILFAAAIIPYAIFIVYIDPSSWRKELASAIQDPDNGDKNIQQIIQDLKKDDFYYWNIAYLQWNQAQIIRAKRTPESIKQAIAKYKDAIAHLDLFGKQNPIHHELRNTMCANCYDGLTLCFLQKQNHDRHALAKADETAKILNSNPTAQDESNEFLSAINNAEKAVRYRRANVQMKGLGTQTAIGLAQSLKLLAQSYTPIRAFDKVGATLEEARKLAHDYEPSTWFEAEILELSADNDIKLNKVEEAAELYKKCLVIKISIYGQNSPETTELGNKMTGLKIR